MPRILLVGVVLMAGCQGVVGPAQRSTLPGVIDDPRLTIEQQQRKGRDWIALPEPSRVAPPTEMESPWTRDSRNR